MQQPLYVSVIVPAYNQAAYLAACLESVQAQTYPYWECLIIDDGSTDNTAAVVAPFVAKDKRFQYVLQTNSGVSAARNTGLDKAQNEWILALDGDDIIATNYLEAAMQYAAQHSDVAVIYAQARFIDGFDAAWELPTYEREKILLQNLWYISAFFKKSIAQSIGGFDVQMLLGLEDWEFWIRYLLSGERSVHQLPIVGFYYRIKQMSRNAAILADNAKHIACKRYIYQKNEALYQQYWGDYQTLLMTYANTKYALDEAEKKLHVIEQRSLKDEMKIRIKKILGRT